MLVGEKLDIIIEGYSSYCVASSRPPLGETPEPESAASGVEFSNCHIDISTLEESKKKQKFEFC